MPEDSPTLIVIGRDADVQQALPKVRQAWRPQKVLAVPQAYQGLAVLLQNARLNLVAVGVDHLSPDEMSFFSVTAIHRPGMRVLAFGKGDKLSNPRLDEAARHGASEALSTDQLPQRLAQLASQGQPRQSATALGPVVNERVDRVVEAVPIEAVNTPIEPVDQAKGEDAQNFLAGRDVAKSRRKAPAAREQTKKTITTTDVVTPEELRVLLGEDDQE